MQKKRRESIILSRQNIFQQKSREPAYIKRFDVARGLWSPHAPSTETYPPAASQTPCINRSESTGPVPMFHFRFGSDSEKPSLIIPLLRKDEQGVDQRKQQ